MHVIMRIKVSSKRKIQQLLKRKSSTKKSVKYDLSVLQDDEYQVRFGSAVASKLSGVTVGLNELNSEIKQAYNEAMAEVLPRLVF